jgi:hypothetical protein
VAVQLEYIGFYRWPQCHHQVDIKDMVRPAEAEEIRLCRAAEDVAARSEDPQMTLFGAGADEI